MKTIGKVSGRSHIEEPPCKRNSRGGCWVCKGLVKFYYLFLFLFWGSWGDYNNKSTSVKLKYVIYSAPLHFVFLCVQ